MTRRAAPLLLPIALILAMSLGACATAPKVAATDRPRTPTEQWVSQVRPVAQPDEIRLSAHRTGLSMNQGDALAAMAGRWMDAEGGEILIQAPTGGGDPAGAYRVATEGRDYLVRQGVPSQLIRINGYDAKGDAAAPVLFGYMRYAVQVPQCGQRWSNLTSTRNNTVDPNFGCAVTANMAAQIANPADLDHPRTMTPADAGRRGAVLDHYRKGEPTTSAKDDQASGAVSKAVD